jgi:hypothetical protein
MRNFGLQEGKKIMFRYRGTGKFAVARQIRQEQAIERNSAYQKQISTPEGIQQYIALTPSIGKKQLTKLNALILTLQKRKK